MEALFRFCRCLPRFNLSHSEPSTLQETIKSFLGTKIVSAALLKIAAEGKEIEKTRWDEEGNDDDEDEELGATINNLEDRLFAEMQANEQESRRLEKEFLEREFRLQAAERSEYFVRAGSKRERERGRGRGKYYYTPGPCRYPPPPPPHTHTHLPSSPPLTPHPPTHPPTQRQCYKPNKNKRARVTVSSASTTSARKRSARAESSRPWPARTPR